MLQRLPRQEGHIPSIKKDWLTTHTLAIIELARDLLDYKELHNRPTLLHTNVEERILRDKQQWADDVVTEAKKH